MNEIMDIYCDRFTLPNDAAEAFGDAARAYVGLSSALSKHYHDNGVLLFAFTVKFHYALHLALISKYQNPAMGKCYAGEDFMQRVRQIVQKCHGGTGPHKCVPKAIVKYAQGLGMHLHSNKWRK